MGRLRPKVLVVDDVEINRKVLCRILERLGYQIIECRTGTEALQEFRRHADSVACVLMDINMPEMDGLEAAFRIRQFEAQSSYKGCSQCSTGHHPAQPRHSMHTCRRCCSEAHRATPVPIWAISACSQDEQLQSPVISLLASSETHKGPLWRSVGIDAFLSKPVRARELLCKLNELEDRITRKNSDLCASGLQNARLENWEEVGVKRRCSLSEPMSAFSRNVKEHNLQQGTYLIASEAD